MDALSSATACSACSFQIDLVEGRQWLADLDVLADLHEALGDLAGDPEAHIGLDPRADGADETALRRFRLVMHGRDQHGAGWLGFRLGFLAAAGQSKGRDQQERSGEWLAESADFGVAEHHERPSNECSKGT